MGLVMTLLVMISRWLGKKCRKNATSAVHVFSSRLGSWKRIGEFDYQMDYQMVQSHDWTSGTVLNGAPHSVVERLGSGMGAVIVYFDATEEKFKEVPSPDCEGANILVNLSDVGLGVLGGLLCVVKHWASHADVWVMKEYGVKESWTKLFVVPNKPESSIPMTVCRCVNANDGEVVMMFDSKVLVSYNPKENSYKTILNDQDRPELDVALYVESLASPHGGSGTKGHL